MDHKAEFIVEIDETSTIASTELEGWSLIVFEIEDDESFEE